MTDVIVVGGGHAGLEAAMACARLKASTLWITQSLDAIGQMSCNPSIGGIGKSHLVREIDAMGGIMALAGDRSGIHFRVLNRSKGPAVRATRAQIDRLLYKQACQSFVNLCDSHLTLLEQSVDDLIIRSGRILGVRTMLRDFHAPCVVLTTGTFLNGIIHHGHQQSSGGRAGQPASTRLAEHLRSLGLPTGRLKTGTPPRIDRRSIESHLLEEQPGDTPCPVLSFLSQPEHHPPQISCWITRTTPQTHEIIDTHLHQSAMYGGAIVGIGPRYCPSIEDKIVRFRHQESHPVFLEPEGLSSFEVYPNGISTSLPFDIQEAFVRTIPGLSKARLTRAGYAIEYDFYDPKCLNPWLETKSIEGLFFAGQINGTTGYEEAAAQGLIAGINAARRAQQLNPFVMQRHEGYMGVLIDDLITQGVTEPYRMFTSRSEYRLLLREDNADARLTELAHQLGLIDSKRYDVWMEKKRKIENGHHELKNTMISGKNLPFVESDDTMTADQWLKRPELHFADLAPWIAPNPYADFIECDIKYEGYVKRHLREIEQFESFRHILIPDTLSYENLSGLSKELKEKLIKHKPKTIEMARMIPGMTPAALTILIIASK